MQAQSPRDGHPPTSAAFASRLIAARRARGWSQDKLAAELDTSPNTVRRWEHRESWPILYYQRKLCEVFDLTAEALGLAGDEGATDAPAVPPRAETLSPDAASLPEGQADSLLPASPARAVAIAPRRVAPRGRRWRGRYAALLLLP